VDDGSRIIYRQLSVTLFCRLTKIRLQNIGRMFGANHHSTVIHAKHMMGRILDATGQARRIGSLAELRLSIEPRRKCRIARRPGGMATARSSQSREGADSSGYSSKFTLDHRVLTRQ
jgi:Bacterial dnaA protein helix-turn-helix